MLLAGDALNAGDSNGAPVWPVGWYYGGGNVGHLDGFTVRAYGGKVRAERRDNCHSWIEPGMGASTLRFLSFQVVFFFGRFRHGPVGEVFVVDWVLL